MQSLGRCAVLHLILSRLPGEPCQSCSLPRSLATRSWPFSPASAAHHNTLVYCPACTNTRWHMRQTAVWASCSLWLWNKPSSETELLDRKRVKADPALQTPQAPSLHMGFTSTGFMAVDRHTCNLTCCLQLMTMTSVLQALGRKDGARLMSF